jgi:hypothetical protein
MRDRCLINAQLLPNFAGFELCAFKMTSIAQILMSITLFYILYGFFSYSSLRKSRWKSKPSSKPLPSNPPRLSSSSTRCYRSWESIQYCTASLMPDFARRRVLWAWYSEENRDKAISLDLYKDESIQLWLLTRSRPSNSRSLCGRWSPSWSSKGDYTWDRATSTWER